MSAIQIRESIVLYIGLVLSVSVHEFGHAKAADLLGDDTPLRQGRVTLNPLAHMDLVGTVIAPLLFLFVLPGSFFFGWGKPVEVSPLRFTRRLSMRAGDTIVSLAGPAMNVLLALGLSLLLFVLVKAGVSPTHPILGAYRGAVVYSYGLRGLVLLNLFLAVFNLLPVPPLDGGHILLNAIPGHRRKFAEFMEQYGMFILLAILVSGILNIVFEPVARLGVSWLQFLGTA